MTKPCIAVLGLVWLCSAAAVAQELVAPEEALARAEKLYAKNSLVEAERYYLVALKGNAGLQRKAAERLLVLYQRVGRPDKAIGISKDLEALLDRLQDRGRRNLLYHEQAICYLNLGHYAESEKLELKALESGTLGPAPHLAALHTLARSLAKQGQHKKAAEYWQLVESHGQVILKNVKTSSPLFVQCAAALAESYQAQGQTAKALAFYASALRVSENDKEKEEACRELILKSSECLVVMKEFTQAESRLRQAYEGADKSESPPDKVLSRLLFRGDLAMRLAELLRTQKLAEPAEKWRQKAAEHYQAVVAGGTKSNALSALTASWKLQALHQRAGQYSQALALLQTEGWSGELLLPRFQAERGNLELLVGSLQKAAKDLRASVARLKDQQPPDLLQLPRALIVLGNLELASGNPGEAEKSGQECLELYSKHNLVQDLVQGELWNMLGCAAVQQGKNKEAMECFRKGLDVFESPGADTQSLEVNLLLNSALLYKSQGELRKAHEHCEKARKLLLDLVEADSLIVAMVDAALASIEANMNQISQAASRAKDILAICKKNKILAGPLFIAAKHCQSLDLLKNGKLKEARRSWTDLEKIQQKEQDLFLPRTLNYLALVEELEGDFDKAEETYRKALDLQKGRSAPLTTHFMTLWGLATVERHRRNYEKACEWLEKIFPLIDSARLGLFGDAAPRIAFFAQFSSAYDNLVDWYLTAGKREAAFLASSRVRARALLDELQFSVDPRSGLTGSARDLLKREEELKAEILKLRARGMMLGPESLDDKRAQALLNDFDALKKKYEDTWLEILNASPVYRQAADDQPEKLLDRLRSKVVNERTLVLAYYFGRDHSYAFLIGPTWLEVYPLTAPENVVNRIGTPPPVTVKQALEEARGIEVVATPPKAPVFQPLGRMVSLDAKTAADLVGQYRMLIRSTNFEPVRGIELKPRLPSLPVGTYTLELPGRILLPEPLVRKIQQAKAQTLVVIPDGPLHTLPLEALLLRVEPLAYALDLLPPMTYAPSAPFLAKLAERKPLPKEGSPALLTVANPNYHQAPPKSSLTVQKLLAMLGKLEVLKGTAEESQRISKLFDPARVVTLKEKAATENGVKSNIPRKRFIHLAVHGFPEQDEDEKDQEERYRVRNLFAALAFTPENDPDDDGFLYRHEIYRLDLKECDLAVLSACYTHVSPRGRLEAGVTLANAFLTAGARHVVASHWLAGDRSTPDLMAAFFENIMDEANPTTYAEALHRARLHTRSRWPSPYYWAAFVLIGPP